jgi:hypothetical protein
MKIRQLAIYLGGVISGILICLLIRSLLTTNHDYVLLEKDYCIEEIGIIKKGSILKFDKAFSEGFSRYVLYVNIHDGEALKEHETTKRNIIIPYWLIENDTTCNFK